VVAAGVQHCGSTWKCGICCAIVCTLVGDVQGECKRGTVTTDVAASNGEHFLVEMLESEP